MCHTDTVDCPPLTSVQYPCQESVTDKVQWLNDPLWNKQSSFTYNFSGWIYKLPLRLNQLYCRFLEKSPWPCSGRSTQQHLIWFLVTRRLREPTPVCPGRASIFPALCVCVYLCAAAKSSTDPIFSSHVSCPRQQLSHKPPSKAHWACLCVLSQPPLLFVSPINTVQQKSIIYQSKCVHSFSFSV